MIIDKCDTLLRTYLRATETTCFISGKHVTPYNSSVGHFRKRRHLTTRWHLKNCHIILNEYQDEGNPQNELMYAKAIDKKYGTGTSEYLVILSHQRNKEDLIEIRDALKELVSYL
jgi:hypothetical protein